MPGDHYDPFGRGSDAAVVGAARDDDTVAARGEDVLAEGMAEGIFCAGGGRKKENKEYIIYVKN
jgi:hypothetical protein